MRRRPSLIPAGDRYSSRGQRPRNARPAQGPTLKGSYYPHLPDPKRARGRWNSTLSGSRNERRVFRGRCHRLLSCALAGHEKRGSRRAKLCDSREIWAGWRRHPVLDVCGVRDSEPHFGIGHLPEFHCAKPQTPEGEVCASPAGLVDALKKLLTSVKRFRA